MPALERLKMLSVGTQSLEDTGHAVGAKYGLRWEAIAGALGYGRVSQNASLYARVKYGRDYGESLAMLERRMYVGPILDLALAGDWVAGQQRIRRLGKATLTEAINEALCGQCGGTGERTIDSKLTTCPTCSGSGHKRYSEAMRAGMLGLEVKNYQRAGWSERWREVMKLYDEFDQELDRALWKAG